MEVWKDIKGYENIYQISSLGRVRSLNRHVLYSDGRKRFYKGNVLSLAIASNGYLSVGLTNNRIRTTYFIHHLVADYFLEEQRNGWKRVVNHKNFIKTDNRVGNLEITTQRKNTNRKHCNSSSKYTGVSWQKNAKKWSCQMHINGKTKYLGLFECEIKASEAYQKKLKEILTDKTVK